MVALILNSRLILVHCHVLICIHSHLLAKFSTQACQMWCFQIILHSEGRQFIFYKNELLICGKKNIYILLLMMKKVFNFALNCLRYMIRSLATSYMNVFMITLCKMKVSPPSSPQPKERERSTFSYSLPGCFQLLYMKYISKFLNDLLKKVIILEYFSTYWIGLDRNLYVL